MMRNETQQVWFGGRWRAKLAVACVFALLAMGTASVQAAGTLSDEIARQVEIIKSSMGGATDISLTEFTDLSRTALSGQIGPGLIEAFKTALKEKKILVNEDAEHVLTGQYIVTDKQSLQAGQPLRLTVKLGLVKRSGQAVVDLLDIKADMDKAKHFARVDRPQDLAMAIGVTARITPDPSPYAPIPKEKRIEELTPQILQPSAVISGTRLRSNEKSEFEVELLVKQVRDQRPAQARKPVLEKGQPFVKIDRNELYEVKIYNNSKRDVAVALTVDGLSVFHFAEKDQCDAEGKPKFSHYIIHPKGHVELDEQGKRIEYDGTATMVGWFQKLAPPDNYLSFLVTEHGKGAISKAGITSRSKVGAIHLQFSHCRPLSGDGRPRGSNETGFGPPRSVKQKAVRYEIELPFDFVTVRYSRS